MPTEEEISSLTLKEFLENVPPGTTLAVADLCTDKRYTSTDTYAHLSRPEVVLHCDQECCGGKRLFKTDTEVVLRSRHQVRAFVVYVCKNCSSSIKTFALLIKGDKDLAGGSIFKYGEVPTFGPPTPARLITLIGPQRELFLKGRRSENQGLGIAAFAYYRRVIEDQKSRIFDEIIRVSKRLSADEALIAELNAAKEEAQFSKAVESVKHALPQALLIDGYNPLTLLHSALSQGLHAQTDEECLELATSIRIVMADFVERVGQAIKDEVELTTAVSRLIKRKAASISGNS